MAETSGQALIVGLSPEWKMNIEYVEVEGSSHSSILQLVEVSGSASEGTFRSEADALRRQRKDFTEKALDILNDLRGSGELCDAILRVDNCSFVVHRNILSASSSYFKAVSTYIITGFYLCKAS